MTPHYAIVQYRGSRHILRLSIGHAEEFISYLATKEMEVQPFYLEAGFKYEIEPTSDANEFVRKWQALPLQTHLNKKPEDLISDRASYIRKFLACIGSNLRPMAVQKPSLQLL